MQHAPRAYAIRLVLESSIREVGANKAAQGQVSKLRSLENALHSWHVFVPMVVESILASANGVLAGCARLQKTEAVFFPLHVLEATTWWSLVHVGFPQTMRQRVIERVLDLRRPKAMEEVDVLLFVCRFCGLLKQYAAEMVEHIRDVHGNILLTS